MTEQQNIPEVQGGTVAPQGGVPLQGGTAPQATQAVLPQQQSFWPIAGALLLGLIIIALVLFWGLAQIKPIPSPGPSDEIVVNVVIPESALATTTKDETANSTVVADAAEKPGYGYRDEWIETGSLGLWLQEGTILEGPALYKPDSFSMGPKARTAIFLPTGGKTTLEEGAISWGFWGRDNTILLAESPYWDEILLFRE